MPTAPGRVCPCGAVVRGRCPRCAALRDQVRGRADVRGYDTRWYHLRNWHMSRHPLCADCEARGVVRIAREVHHVIPFEGIEDPRRLDPGNLRSLCKPCHARTTYEAHHGKAK